jgi:hypothetical protein
MAEDDLPRMYSEGREEFFVKWLATLKKEVELVHIPVAVRFAHLLQASPPVLDSAQTRLCAETVDRLLTCIRECCLLDTQTTAEHAPVHQACVKSVWAWLQAKDEYKAVSAKTKDFVGGLREDWAKESIDNQKSMTVEQFLTWFTARATEAVMYFAKNSRYSSTG